MKKISLMLLLISFPCGLWADAFTPFVEDVKTGETGTRSCRVIPAGFDAKWEYFVVVVHSDTGDTYGLRGRAKPGMVDIYKAANSEYCSVTAKVLKKEFHKSKRIANVELELLKVTPRK